MRLLETMTRTNAEKMEPLGEVGQALAREGASFLKSVIVLSKKAHATTDTKELLALERDLRRAHKTYLENIETHINHHHKTTQKFLKRGGKEKSHREMNEEIKRLRPLLENYIYRHAMTAMHLERVITQNRRHIKKILKDMAYKTGRPDQKVDDPTLLLVKRSYEQKNKLSEKRQKIVERQDLLEQLDEHFVQLAKYLHPVIGFFTSKSQLSKFRGALRYKNFAKAHAIYEEWTSYKSLFGLGRRSIEKTKYHAKAILDLVAAHQDQLESSGMITLSGTETGLMLAVIQEEEKNIARFLDKYALASVLYCYRNVLRLNFRLSRMKTIQEIIELHTKMILLQNITTLDDLQVARARENTLLPISTVLVQDLPVLPDLFNKLETMLEPLTFHVSMAQKYYLS